MYASIRKYRTDAAEEVLQRVQGSFLPLVSKIPGFIAYYGVDPGDGTVVFVNVFDDHAGAETSNRLAAEWTKKNLSSLVLTPPAITAGNVVMYAASGKERRAWHSGG